MAGNNDDRRPIPAENQGLALAMKLFCVIFISSQIYGAFGSFFTASDGGKSNVAFISALEEPDRVMDRKYKCRENCEDLELY